MTDRELIEAVATLLCQKAATGSNFFFELAALMYERGYTIEANQLGIQGTHLQVIKL